MVDDKNQKEKEEAGGPRAVYTNTERTEYFSKLEKWLVEAYAWHSFVATVPYIIASSQMLHGATAIGSSNLGATLANANINTTSDEQQTNNNNGLHQRRVNDVTPPPQFQTPGVTGITYRIPPVWKRLVAEFIDSLLFFVLKLSITLLAIDIFDFFDIEEYYFEVLKSKLTTIDYKMALELTSGLLLLELIHRIFVCIFEASWLRHGRNGRIGGATPGKSIMRLKVVLCKNVTPIGAPDDGVVLVVPGTDLGLLPALGRSALKNLILALYFPICFAVCFFRFNRAGYDLVCNTIVVEDTHRNGNNNINNINNNNNNVNINARLHQD